jgi:transposase, IS5 family
VEESLYDSRAMSRFAGIDLGRERVPDETTICKFRHLLEANNLGERPFVLIGQYLDENGMKVNRGTIVDATIINAPSSTKNKKGEASVWLHEGSIPWAAQERHAPEDMPVQRLNVRLNAASES